MESERSPILAAGIRNFRKVTDWLYRGGQPSDKGIAYLRTLDVATVVSLRWNPGIVAEEGRAVMAAGMNYESIPLNYWAPPSDEQIRRFLAILDEEKNRPVFVHCLHGSDRTGVAIAIFRMARQGWGVEDAYREMKECGFHQLWVYHMKFTVFGFARKLSRGESF